MYMHIVWQLKRLQFSFSLPRNAKKYEKKDPGVWSLSLAIPENDLKRRRVVLVPSPSARKTEKPKKPKKAAK